MGKSVDLIGQRFGRLVVIEKSEKRDSGGNVFWLCKCDCGKDTLVSTHSLKIGHCKSCGCYKIDVNREQGKRCFTKHGKKYTRIYNIWCSMKQRCYGKNVKSYKYYGARGITICDEWKNDFMSFYNWAMNNGYQDNLTIDRINVNGNYEPSNCRWVTAYEQANNKRSNHVIIYNGVEMTVKQLSELCDIQYHTLLGRLLKGWTVDRAVNQPIRIRKSGKNENNIK